MKLSGSPESERQVGRTSRQVDWAVGGGRGMVKRTGRTGRLADGADGRTSGLVDRADGQTGGLADRPNGRTGGRADEGVGLGSKGHIPPTPFHS